MAGIYLHIPFCRQACHYCNFHFATSLRYKNEFVAALLKEISLRRDYLGGEEVETIYFGGGTPSLLDPSEVRQIVGRIRDQFPVSANPELTLESNPDDMNEATIAGWQKAGINRLSLGVQSFFDEDLIWMNRAHRAVEAKQALKLATMAFGNVTADLIYGLPGLSDERWKQNVDQMLSMNIPHLSCYALTVEEKTPLHRQIRSGTFPAVEPDRQSEQFLLLIDWLEKSGYEHYEISNFARPGFQSRHNSSYWQGKKYLGLGPSAHSYNSSSRQWNVANNQRYILSIQQGVVPFEIEKLTPVQQLNEYIMTALRTREGISLERIPKELQPELMKKAAKFTGQGSLAEADNFLRLTREGKLLADGIAAELFFD